jgi:hypothetical protein
MIRIGTPTRRRIERPVERPTTEEILRAAR